MFPQSKLSKLALVTATGALAAATAVGPAFAAAPANDGHAPYKGRVIAKTGLLVRTGPSTHYKVIGKHGYGKVVHIVCKVNGQNIRGNPRWYLLSDGTYGWSSARYIVNIGRAPAWC
ncbi:SH3 domain-containing protein [Streptomyces sp. NPDC057654]|uniref:SH3 domain-containing protein n=1 Tax=Streptomyces sp. NPDC057654 TaxID=3346196 RepID=UPI0036AA1406